MATSPVQTAYAEMPALPLSYELTPEIVQGNPNEEFSADIAKEYKNLTDQAWINQFLAILCTVAFAIIAVGALTVASFFAPIAIPFILLGTGALIPIFKQYVYDHFRDKECSFNQQAEVHKGFVEKYNELNELDDAALRAHILDSGILNIALMDQTSRDAVLGRMDAIARERGISPFRLMLPVVAKYEACIEAMEKRQAALGEARESINQKITDKLSRRELTHKDRHYLLQHNGVKAAHDYRTTDIQILQLKVQAAWYYHLLHHPFHLASMEDSAYLYQLDTLTRLANLEEAGRQGQSPLGAPLQDPYLGLADRAGTVLSRRLVMRLSPEQLSFAFSRGGESVERFFAVLERMHSLGRSRHFRRRRAGAHHTPASPASPASSSGHAGRRGHSRRTPSTSSHSSDGRERSRAEYRRAAELAAATGDHRH